MTTWEIIGLVLALLVMLVGTVGSVVPVLPGAPLVLGAAVVHRFVFGAAGASWVVLGVLAALTLFSVLLDFAATAYGAKKLGATWRGITGAILGTVPGMFFGLPGIVLGPFLGAMVLEMAGGKGLHPAVKGGAGAVLGLFLGGVGKLAICGSMMALFTIHVVQRSLAFT